MSNQKFRYIFLPFLFVGTIIFASNFTGSPTEKTNTSATAEMAIATNEEDNFTKMMAVLTHQRCVNCHPNDNIPKQGEDSHPHYFGLTGGEEDQGYEATNCGTCHQAENNDYSGVPGAPEWALAPQSMKWEGLTRIEIAKSILDPERNGGRSHQEVKKHLTEHELVLWAWTPGIDAAGNPRELPPVPKDEYIAAVKAWFEAGAIIPEK